MSAGGRAAVAAVGLAVAVLGAAWKAHVHEVAHAALQGEADECGTGGCAARDGTPVDAETAQEDVEVEIAYCLRCKWGLRAAWMAQELLSTFERDFKKVSLAPSMEGGTYKIIVRREGVETVVYDRRETGTFPQPKDVKKLLRDAAFPDRALGKCLEGKGKTPSSSPP